MMDTPPGQPVPRTTIWVPAPALEVLGEFWAPVASRGTEAEPMRPVAMDAPQDRGGVVDAAACADAAVAASSTQQVARAARAHRIHTALPVGCHPCARACVAVRLSMRAPSYAVASYRWKLALRSCDASRRDEATHYNTTMRHGITTLGCTPRASRCVAA